MRSVCLTKRAIQLALWIIALTLASFGSARALSNCFVSPSGDDKNDGLSPNTAFKTIQKGINAGLGRVIVAAGVYPESLTWDNKGPLLILGAGAGQCIIDPGLGPGGRGLTTSGLTSGFTISGFTFRNGHADEAGGMYNNLSSPTVINCVFLRNGADSLVGGGMLNDKGNPTLINCVFLENSTGRYGSGGGMFNRGGFDGGSNPTIINCTFTRNSAGNGGGAIGSSYGSAPVLTNCILWGDAGGEIENVIGASPVITYCDIQGYASTPDTNHNFGADPLFVDAANGNVRIPSGSPGVDKGNDTVVTVPPFPADTSGTALDLVGKARIYGAHVDLGACEYQDKAPTAKTGGDQTVTATHSGDPANDTASVTLDGSQSSDPDDGDSLTFSWNDGQGDTSTDAKQTFTLAPGSYAFILTVTDLYGAQSTTTANITVKKAPNQTPTTSGQSVSLDQDGSGDITLSGSDPDGDSLTYTVASNPAHGVLTGDAPNLTYTPSAGYVGTDSFTFTVTDTYSATSSEATVSITVKDKTPPVITTPGDITVIASSASGKVVTFTASATDNVDGTVPVTCAPPSGSLFAPGKMTVTCTAQDKAGNQASASFNVWVQYSWSGFLAPLSKQSANRGSALPVKFQLTGASAPITNLSANLYVTAPGATSETLLGTFKYDSTAKQYVFIWNTSKTMPTGTYTLRADLGDGVTNRTTSITLK